MMLFLHIKYITSKNTIKTVTVMEYTFKKYKWLINLIKILNIVSYLRMQIESIRF